MANRSARLRVNVLGCRLIIIRSAYSAVEVSDQFSKLGCATIKSSRSFSSAPFARTSLNFSGLTLFPIDSPVAAAKAKSSMVKLAPYSAKRLCQADLHEVDNSNSSNHLLNHL